MQSIITKKLLLTSNVSYNRKPVEDYLGSTSAVDLSNCGITSLELSKILAELGRYDEETHHITTINLSGNLIDDSNNVLSFTIFENRYIQNWDLSNNKITDKQAQNILHRLNHSTVAWRVVRQIKLDGNPISQNILDDIQFLLNVPADRLIESPLILKKVLLLVHREEVLTGYLDKYIGQAKAIDLSNCDINPQEAGLVPRLLQYTQNPIAHINLAGNNLDNVGNNRFYHCYRRGPHSCDLSNNNITDQGAQNILAEIKQSPYKHNVLKLDLSGNPISPQLLAEIYALIN